MTKLLELVNLWNNPVLRRFLRSRLRFRKAIFWYLLTLIITTFVVALTYIISTNSGASGRAAARALWIPLLIIQGLILMIKGTGSAAAGLIQDKLDQTLDYQRLTPMTPIRNLLGYLFGLPILEYAMVGLTLPHLAFIVMVGQIPLGALSSVYLAFFTCVILYHMTGIAIGMIMQRWIWGYLLSIFMVVFLNVILPTFISQLGLKFLQYLSVWPVIGQKVVPVVLPPGALAAIQSRNVFLSMADSVPFYDWTLTPFVFTLSLQGTLIVTFASMALRRWKFSGKHSLSKPYALAFLCGFITLLMGNVWPIITGRYMPFALFGETNIEALREPVAIGLPLVYCLVVWILCLVLFAIVIPSHHAYVRGIRRALKLGQVGAAPWDDDSASLPFMSFFTIAALIGFWTLSREIAASGFLDFLAASGLGAWRLPLAFGLVLVYTTLLLQVMELKPTALVILLLWFLPILAAIVLGAAMQMAGIPQAVVASVSPLALVLMAGMIPIGAVGGGAVGGASEFAALQAGVYTGLAFVSIQIVWLRLRWRKLKDAYYAACRSQAAR